MSFVVDGTTKGAWSGRASKLRRCKPYIFYPTMGMHTNVAPEISSTKILWHPLLNAHIDVT